MAVSHDDVRRIANLARLAIPDDQIDALARNLSGILTHIDALAQVSATHSAPELDGMRLAADSGPSVHLSRPLSEFAPKTRDGFFLVPRLSTHESAGEAS